MSYRLHACPLCGEEAFAPVMRARDYHYGNPGEFTQAQCLSCKLVFLDPMYDEAELAGFYPQNYYAFSDRFAVASPPRSLKAQIWKWLGLREHSTRDPHFARPGRMLDIGCGSGWFMSQMRDQGWQVSGVEPNAEAAEFGNRAKGLQIFAGSLLSAGFPPSSFDYVRLNHSFEHMVNPNEVLDEIHRILADNGKLMIGVPNRDGLNARLFGRYWYHLALPVHTFSYSVKTLSQMLEKHRFKVEKVVYNTDLHTVLLNVQLYLNRKDVELVVQGRFVRSRIATLLCCWIAHLQNFFRVADLIELTATKSFGE